MSCPGSEDNTNSQSAVSETELCLLQSEADNLEMAVCTVQNTKTWHFNINDLSDEILVMILSHIPASELVNVIQKVCSRWERLSKDAKVWTDKVYEIREWSEPDTDTCMGDSADQEVIRTLCDLPNLCKLRMLRGVSSRVFETLYTRCQKLTELHLYYSQKLSYSVLEKLVEKCSKIHTLTISSELLMFEKYAKAVSQWQHLRVLYLEKGPMQRPPLLRPLCNGCPQLSEVDFKWMDVDMNHLRHFLYAKKNTLKFIRIKWTMKEGRCVLPLLTVCADVLERLILYNYYMVFDQAREAFTALGALKNLRELRTAITKPPPPGTAPLAFMSGGLPKLTLLDLGQGYGLDNNTIIAICHGCPALRELNVKGAELLSDAAFSQIHRLKYLEILDVSGCIGVSAALIPQLTMLPQLHTLSMEGFEFPKSVPVVRSILELSGLLFLSLDYSTVTGVPFDKFPENLIRLRELHIDRFRGDSIVMDVLAKQMPDLRIHGNFIVEVPADMDADWPW